MTIDKQANATAAGDEPVSPITFRLDPASGVPTYLQLVQQVEQALRLRYLRLGDQLPRVKDVVGTLSINPNTVLKAYRELEHRGIATGRPGQGTFVESEPATIALKDLARLRRRLLSGWLQEALETGLDEEGITALFASAAHELFRAGGERRGQPGDEVVA
jgi:GntR family transcriptional regulator